MMSLILIFFLVGAAGGFTAGLFGVGGGLVIVPTLYVLWRDDPLLGPDVMHFAVATSLACIVITSLTSTWIHWRAKRIRPGVGVWLTAGVGMGAVLAVSLVASLPTVGLKLGFGFFALIMAISMLRQPVRITSDVSPQPTELIGVGVVIGHISTLLGVSGGAMTVPYLVTRGTDMRDAVVVSSAVAIFISMIGAVGMGLVGPNLPNTWGYVHWPAFVGISASSLFFAAWGARVSQVINRDKLQKSFAGFLLLVAMHMFAS
ncbi:sulfite exporter TauE/SafE family protein [Limnohabitans sp. MORI2]|uniref:sulfite exporter TauE/SafE family protein n=1 Tax=Limnohabitans sp. MORI2 TaxID=1751150 RepID=UPI00248F660F|nr:sulfite exporter TauE/SafE family protein [Limnohabitans sp. MORI2]